MNPHCPPYYSGLRFYAFKRWTSSFLGMRYYSNLDGCSFLLPFVLTTTLLHKETSRKETVFY